MGFNPKRHKYFNYTLPYGILDKSRSGKSIGCEKLRKKLKNLQVKVHVFDHIHESYGEAVYGKTTFINASNMNSIKGLVNQPIVFEL